MKTFLKIILAVMALGWACARTDAEPSKNAADQAVPGHSTFTIPTNVREGRDPFFPESTRAFEVHAAASRTVEISALTVKGISGPPDHRLVIINNHTFGVGDENDVITPTGRIHLRCTDIQANQVTIEINGQSHELHFGLQ